MLAQAASMTVPIVIMPTLRVVTVRGDGYVPIRVPTEAHVKQFWPSHRSVAGAIACNLVL